MILISKTLEDHLSHLREVLLLLRKNSLFANRDKCTFCVDSVVFLGFVPSRIRALTKSKSKSTPGVKVNIRRRLDKGTPSASFAKRKRRQGKAPPRRRRRPTRASPRANIIKSKQSQHDSPIPRGRKDHGGSGAVVRPQVPIIWEVIKRRKRWLQGHSDSTSVGQPDS